MPSPYEQALLDCWHGTLQDSLYVESSLGDREEMPVEIFFREADELTELEALALARCQGSILDVGAGAGCLSLILQRHGHNVEALEVSRACVELMLYQGIANIYHDNFYEFNAAQFDTLLVLMNGIGLAGTLPNVPVFLQQLKRLTNKGGQVLIDSSDIAYAYEGAPLPTAHYYGEVRYRYQYGKHTGAWFEWLYLDRVRFAQEARAAGWQFELLFEDEYEQFLCRLYH